MDIDIKDFTAYDTSKIIALNREDRYRAWTMRFEAVIAELIHLNPDKKFKNLWAIHKEIIKINPSIKYNTLFLKTHDKVKTGNKGRNLFDPYIVEILSPLLPDGYFQNLRSVANTMDTKLAVQCGCDALTGNHYSSIIAFYEALPELIRRAVSRQTIYNYTELGNKRYNAEIDHLIRQMVSIQPRQHR
ncbi:MAG: hypothetical protein LBB23_01830 [Rickettsiales bacterium]|jgi:hypothetical protein|nr:hypothetical protein [Rickettsiales bacterium]